HLTVPDVDAAVERARAVGATVERPATDAPYGRTGVILDPYGHRWMLQTPAQAPGAGPRSTWPSRCPTAPAPATSTRRCSAGARCPAGSRTAGRSRTPRR